MSRILTEFYATPWAVLPDVLMRMQRVLARWDSGVRLDAEQIKAAIGDAPEVNAQRVAASKKKSGGGVAVVPIYGVITGRAKDEIQASTRLMSAERLGKTVSALADDPSIDAIVLDVDSPGGSVFGIQEAADAIMQARGKKKVVAVANGLAASAAYWLATAADEVYVAPSGMVGSVGVYAAHEDHSAALESEGVKVTLISAGDYKVEGNPYEPLSQDAKDEMQRQINSFYKDFVGAVAKQRGVTVEAVEENFGQGRVVRDSEAVSRGMADGVATLDQVVSKLQNPQGRRRRRMAAEKRLELEKLN